MYDTCAYCEKVRTYTPWRTVACSVECYEVYLAYLHWRDGGRDDALFTKTVDRIAGPDGCKLTDNMQAVYDRGKAASENAASPSEPASPTPSRRKARTGKK